MISVMTEICSIHEAIKSISPIDFTNPHLLSNLPFPSPLQVPKEHFTITSNTDTVQKFQSMGWSIFKDILKEVQDPIGHTISTSMAPLGWVNPTYLWP
jgi:hypothetical protein